MGEISDAFLSGIQEIYTILFVEELFISLLNETSSQKNIYGESINKTYFPPIQVTGNVKLDNKVGEETVEVLNREAVIKIPAKEFLDKGVNTSLDVLLKAKFTFQQKDYLVSNVKPSTNIQGEFLSYVFSCNEVKKKSGE